MVKFDRIKIKTNYLFAGDFDPDCFDWNTDSNDSYTSAVYHSLKSGKKTYPFDLEIKINFLSKEMILDIPAKVLQDSYPDLISINNIEYVFFCINKLEVIELDYKSILNDSKLISAAITQDVAAPLTESDYQLLSLTVGNVSRWLSDQHPSRILFNKDVSTGNRKLSLSIYNKHPELLRWENKEFRSWVNDEMSLLNRFKNITRLELNLKSFLQIREAFGSDDLELIPILSSNSTPIKDTMEKILDYDSIFQKSSSTSYVGESIGDYKKFLVLKDCDFQMDKLKVTIDQYYGKNTNRRKVKGDYQKILRELNSHYSFQPNAYQNIIDLINKLRY